MLKLKVNELFTSIQGEGKFQGERCTFLRLSGCNFNCKWCDTPYRNEINHKWTIAKTFKKIQKIDCSYVCITGGEPYLQLEAVGELVEMLTEHGYKVEINTNGSYEPQLNCYHAVDYKLPSSGMFGRSSVYEKTFRGWYMFVIANRADYKIAKALAQVIKQGVYFSPCWGKLGKRQLAEWIIEDKLDVKLNIQIHKVIWPAKMRGV